MYFTASKCPIAVVDFISNVAVSSKKYENKIGYIPYPKHQHSEQNKQFILRKIARPEKDSWVLIKGEDLTNMTYIEHIHDLADSREKKMEESGLNASLSPVNVLIITKSKKKIPILWQDKASLACIQTPLETSEEIFDFISGHFNNKLNKITQYLVNSQTGKHLTVYVSAFIYVK